MDGGNLGPLKLTQRDTACKNPMAALRLRRLRLWRERLPPAPHWMHQRIIGRFFELVAPSVRLHALGETFLSPLDVQLEPGLVLQPDLLAVPAGELKRRSHVVRHLLLAVEIVSPSSARYDRVRKRPYYQRNRVSEYWIVDEMSQTIERWTPDDERPDLLAERLVWDPLGASEPFALDIVQFFKSVAAED